MDLLKSSFAVKITEKLVLSQLLDHPNMNSLLDQYQSVYRTETIENIVNDLTALDGR